MIRAVRVGYDYFYGFCAVLGRVGFYVGKIDFFDVRSEVESLAADERYRLDRGVRAYASVKSIETVSAVISSC